MSQIEQIISELRTMTTSVDSAQATAAQADGKALEVATRAARMGFVGIAQSVAQVRDAIQEIQARVATIKGSLSEATKPVTAAPQEISPEQSIAMLSPALETINTAATSVAATINKINDTQRLTVRILQGGQPAPMVAALEGIKQILTQVAQRCDVTKQLLGAAIAEARQTGDSGR